MTPAEAWLRDHAADAPSMLLDRMVAALREPGEDVPGTLADAALDLYRAALRGQGERTDALPLLAADALFTQAFEAQAALDPAGVSPLAERFGARGALRELIS